MHQSILLPILAFIAAAGVLTITPGVDTAMVLRSATVGGPKSGAGAGLGICAGLLVWGLAAALGLTALLAASTMAFAVIKWAGAAYLVYLGAKLLARPRTSLGKASVSIIDPGDQGAAASLRRGFITNMLNPKIGIFYITFLPQFIPPGVSVPAFTFFLACIHVLLTSAWFFVLIGLTVPLSRILARPPVVRTLDRLTGCVFMGFGVNLALGHRT